MTNGLVMNWYKIKWINKYHRHLKIIYLEKIYPNQQQCDSTWSNIVKLAN